MVNLGLVLDYVSLYSIIILPRYSDICCASCIRRSDRSSAASNWNFFVSEAKHHDSGTHCDTLLTKSTPCQHNFAHTHHVLVYRIDQSPTLSFIPPSRVGFNFLLIISDYRRRQLKVSRISQLLSVVIYFFSANQQAASLIKQSMLKIAALWPPPSPRAGVAAPNEKKWEDEVT